MTWPRDYVLCEMSQLEAPGVDRAVCPYCGSDCVIAGTPSFPRWPSHSYRQVDAPDVDLGDVLRRLPLARIVSLEEMGDRLQRDIDRADAHDAMVHAYDEATA